MLNKLPLRVMERILELLDIGSYQELAFVSPKMWKIVEETPKKHESVKIFSEPSLWGLGFISVDGLSNPIFMIVQLSKLPPWAFKDGRPTLQMPASNSRKERIARSSFLRLFLNNATCQDLFDAPLSYGNQFWCSLNTKVVRLCNPRIGSIARLQEFIDHFKPTDFIHDTFASIAIRDREDCATFLLSPAVCSLETLHIQHSFRILPLFGDSGAKDLLVQAYDEPTVVEWEALIWFVLTRVVAWLEGRVEIDKTHLLVGGVESCAEEAEVMAQITNQIARLVLRRPDRGWIDRTYEGLNLVLRTSDGQALVFYWDALDSSLLLLRSEYNFRRGRCFGSYERNGKALAEIRELMRDWQIQIKQNPVRVAETKEKLKLECAKFNEYNRGATTQDLLIDAIWRSTSQRRSPWARCGENNTILRSATYPLDLTLRHAYDFAKAYEARGELPDVDEFKPAANIDLWQQTYRDFVV